MARVVDDNADAQGKDGKGRATPSRREAEQARKKQMKTPMTRKQQTKRDRGARDELRRKQQQALRTGDEKHLPARERGPARRFLRDYVDRRWNVAEFMLPILLVILVLSYIGQPWSLAMVTFMWTFTIVAVVLDTFVLLRGLKREFLLRPFDAEQTSGARFYALLRSTQLRRFRLPRAQVSRGEKLPDTYR